MSADVPADPPPFTVDIRVEQRARLTVADIWPDGDAPPNPTVEDAIEVIKHSTARPRDVLVNWDEINIFVNAKRIRW